MTIQPFSVNSYSEIPDNEDVTPIDGAIAKRTKKSLKYLIVSIAIMVVVIGSLTYTGYFAFHLIKYVQIFETSPKSMKMNELTLKDFKSNGFSLNYVGFSNNFIVDYNDNNKNKIKSNLISNTDTYSKIVINSNLKYQKILGFGGAITEASAHNYYKLPKNKQKEIMQLYYDETDGLGLNLARRAINSCDFSLESYNFDNVTNDYDLKYFDTNVSLFLCVFYLRFF